MGWFLMMTVDWGQVALVGCWDCLGKYLIKQEAFLEKFLEVVERWDIRVDKDAICRCMAGYEAQVELKKLL